MQNSERKEDLRDVSFFNILRMSLHRLTKTTDVYVLRQITLTLGR